MEIVIEPSMPLLEITPRCWTDCCVADCGGFCIRDCSSIVMLIVAIVL